LCDVVFYDNIMLKRYKGEGGEKREEGKVERDEGEIGQG
jgi:hypothetical protein